MVRSTKRQQSKLRVSAQKKSKTNPMKSKRKTLTGGSSLSVDQGLKELMTPCNTAEKIKFTQKVKDKGIEIHFRKKKYLIFEKFTCKLLFKKGITEPWLLLFLKNETEDLIKIGFEEDHFNQIINKLKNKGFDIQKSNEYHTLWEQFYRLYRFHKYHKEEGEDELTSKFYKDLDQQNNNQQTFYELLEPEKQQLYIELKKNQKEFYSELIRYYHMEEYLELLLEKNPEQQKILQDDFNKKLESTEKQKYDQLKSSQENFLESLSSQNEYNELQKKYNELESSQQTFFKELDSDQKETYLELSLLSLKQPASGIQPQTVGASVKEPGTVAAPPPAPPAPPELPPAPPVQISPPGSSAYGASRKKKLSKRKKLSQKKRRP